MNPSLLNQLPCIKYQGLLIAEPWSRNVIEFLDMMIVSPTEENYILNNFLTIELLFFLALIVFFASLFATDLLFILICDGIEVFLFIALLEMIEDFTLLMHLEGVESIPIFQLSVSFMPITMVLMMAILFVFTVYLVLTSWAQNLLKKY